ncbi:Glutamate receptor ionotropic, kainate 2 [Cryptotermes secundus]|uniref:Glutamate receptor 1 n=2 Tax=Cryptotermes secundus TaxID=105785 RepID=A0A2J7QQL5_9NEOP|nr:Glutamate receptor ionotropic, kainate 2 [Cryptotermes secundus]
MAPCTEMAGRALLVAVLCCGNLVAALPDVIRIGGLFHPADDRQEVAFRYAVERINDDRTILPRSRLSAQIEKISPQDSFHASKRVCHLLRSGVAAIFGPQSGQTASHVQSICDTMEIPHLETRWDYRLRRESCLVNLYPHPTALSKAYVDLVRAWGWRSFTIIYESNEGLVRLQELLKAHGPSEFPITVRQLGEGADYRPLLKQIKNSAESHIVLDCNTERIYDVLKQAQQIGMMSDYHSYLITSLDLHSVDLEEFKYGGTNITALRLVDPEKPELQKVVRNWVYGELRYGRKLDLPPPRDNLTFIKTETALMYDAVHLFAKALHDLDSSQRIDIKPLSCDAVDTWPHGYSLINYMKIVEMQGLTGVIKFDNQGFRSNFVLDIVELSKDGLKKIGTWNSTEGVNFTRTYGEAYTQIVESLQNKTFVVTTILSSPYCMRKDSSEKLSGNAQFEGYGLDLVHEISKILGFNYTFKLVPDGRYGSLNRETKEWDGMMKELLDQKADIAIADLTITYDREQAVDFTMPFMNLGISILYRKPIKQPPNLFSFLSPLSLDVWIYMATAYLGVSVLLFILARFSPYEWDNPHPCNDEPDVLENQFSLLNSLWFTIGSLMQQGSDIAPKAVSTRMVAGMWWFFTLIMISSYTANLAAFLTVERMDSPIESAEDLAKQTKIKYGALKGGSTAAFFRDSNFSTYQRMWSFMESARPSVFTSSNMEGVERVVKGKGNYAFLMESTSIEYVIERNCELTQVGGLLDSKGYGIAMPPNSPYRTAISGAVLKLQEEGKLHILKTRWWKEKRGGGACRDDTSKSSSAANELGLANVGGVFVVLMGGMGVACVIAVCEFVWKSRKVAMEERLDSFPEQNRVVVQQHQCNGSLLKTSGQ